MSSSTSQQTLKLLAVVAHPHDITHMLGTCANHIERGDSVTVVSTTGGVRTHNEKLYDELLKDIGERNKEILNQSPEEYGEQKGREMMGACRLFGISDVRILPFSDVTLRVTDQLVQILADIVSEVRPHILLTHAPYSLPARGRQRATLEDHMVTGMAIQQALWRAGRAEYGSDQRPHQVAQTYYTGVDFPYQDIDMSIDISKHAENRVKAEMAFTTQEHTGEFAVKRIEISAGHYGWYAGVAYAEPFVRADRQMVDKYLLVTDYDLKTAEMFHKDLFARMAGEGSENK